MPLAHFKLGDLEVKNKRFSTPKRLDRPESWVTSARKAIPEIPRLGPSSEWIVSDFDPSLSIILVKLLNARTLEQAKLAIMR